MPKYWTKYRNTRPDSLLVLFMGTSDLRKTLSWGGRFEDLPNRTSVWNFRSSGDQVFKPHTGNSVSPLGRIGEAFWVSLTTLSLDGFAFEAFALQEKFKGRNRFTDEVLGSTYGGWGLNPDWEIRAARTRPGGSASRRTLMVRHFPEWETGNPPLTDTALQANPFFKNSKVPDLYDSSQGSAFVNSTDENGQRWGYRLKAQMIPAVTNATGRFPVLTWQPAGAPSRNIDMNEMHRTDAPNGWAWPRSDPAWRHSDFKNVSYLYTYKMFDELLDRGEIQSK